MSKKRLTREESKQQTRKELLKVASEMFAKQGFYSTSVDQIAEEAGYSKGAIYSNFGSKDDLFLSVFKENQKEDLQNLKTIAEKYNSLDEFINMIEQNHQYERKENQDWSILKLEFLLYAMRDASVREKLAPILQESRSQMINILKGFYQPNDQKHLVSIDKLAFLLLSLDIGIGIQSYVDEESIPENVFAEGLKLLLKA
ncbi:TetR/AcrR family transcriptional regulator [Virgibacillus proomii]|uniref:TetR/AcrR family transcriptional regulator n=1 Tax=Virgibacillus proomii TaxID=84407 RepID=UPI001C1168BD|nr:TetR/AcrR family transcriptional regulator [Virgibacillus proomii]MBU5267528.1 TetR/AcrR family transcriptional regulator [Virgibacillus proomii]